MSTTQSPRDPSYRGFTLLELAVVGAIVGVLSAIAVPSFLRYRCRAQQTEVRAVLKSLGSGLSGYVAEHNPPAAPSTIFRTCPGVDVSNPAGLEVKTKSKHYQYGFELFGSGADPMWQLTAAGCAGTQFVGEAYVLKSSTQAALPDVGHVDACGSM